MVKIFIEIELDGIICAKSLNIPISIKNDFVLRNQYIRDYYINLGYKVGENIRLC